MSQRGVQGAKNETLTLRSGPLGDKGATEKRGEKGRPGCGKRIERRIVRAQPNAVQKEKKNLQARPVASRTRFMVTEATALARSALRERIASSPARSSAISR